MEFSDALKELRKKRGLSQSKLAAITGFSQSAIGYWERGEKTPSVSAVSKIATALGVNASDLMDLYAIDALDNNPETQKIISEWKPLFKRLGYGVGQPYACKDESGSIVEVELKKDGKTKTVSSAELFSIKKQAEEELKEVLNALIFEKTYEFLKSKKFDGDE